VFHKGFYSAWEDICMYGNIVYATNSKDPYMQKDSGFNIKLHDWVFECHRCRSHCSCNSENSWANNSRHFFGARWSLVEHPFSCIHLLLWMTMHSEELPTIVFHTCTFLHSFPLIDVLTHQCLAASGSSLQVTDF
jgi:hypothetical protein